MVVYLLEKSRLTYQQPLERCYHAFYNIMSDEVLLRMRPFKTKFCFLQVKDLKAKCHLSVSPSVSKDSAILISNPQDNILDYWFVSQGKLTVPSIDDREDMQFANEAFDILGFSEEMKYNVSNEAK